MRKPLMLRALTRTTIAGAFAAAIMVPMLGVPAAFADNENETCVPHPASSTATRPTASTRITPHARVWFTCSEQIELNASSDLTASSAPPEPDMQQTFNIQPINIPQGATGHIDCGTVHDNPRVHHGSAHRVGNPTCDGSSISITLWAQAQSAWYDPFGHHTGDITDDVSYDYYDFVPSGDRN